MAEST